MAMSATMKSRLVEIDYTNYKGERRKRLIYPISMKFTENEWHKGLQWIVVAIDYGDNPNGLGLERSFAMTGIHSWAPAKTNW